MCSFRWFIDVAAATLCSCGCSTMLSRLSSVLPYLHVQEFASSIDWFINRDYDHHIHCGWHHHHHHITITIIFTVFLWRSWFFSSTLSSSPACASLSLWRKNITKPLCFFKFVKFFFLNFQILKYVYLSNLPRSSSSK